MVLLNLFFQKFKNNELENFDICISDLAIARALIFLPCNELSFSKPATFSKADCVECDLAKLLSRICNFEFCILESAIARALIF